MPGQSGEDLWVRKNFELCLQERGKITSRKSRETWGRACGMPQRPEKAADIDFLVIVDTVFWLFGNSSSIMCALQRF